MPVVAEDAFRCATDDVEISISSEFESVRIVQPTTFRGHERIDKGATPAVKSKNSMISAGNVEIAVRSIDNVPWLVEAVTACERVDELPSPGVISANGVCAVTSYKEIAMRIKNQSKWLTQSIITNIICRVRRMNLRAVANELSRFDIEGEHSMLASAAHMDATVANRHLPRMLDIRMRGSHAQKVPSLAVETQDVVRAHIAYV